jgi:regulator of replication initiation timing
MDKDEVQVMIDAAQVSIEDMVRDIVGDAQRHIEERMDENYQDINRSIQETFDNNTELCTGDQKLLDRLDEDVRDFMSTYKRDKTYELGHAGRD